MMHIKQGRKTLALLPAGFVARAPLLDRKKIKTKVSPKNKNFQKFKKHFKLF